MGGGKVKGGPCKVGGNGRRRAMSIRPLKSKMTTAGQESQRLLDADGKCQGSRGVGLSTQEERNNADKEDGNERKRESVERSAQG